MITLLIMRKATEHDYQKIADFINADVNPQFLAVLDSEEAKFLVLEETEASIRDAVNHGNTFYLVFDEKSEIKALASGREKDLKTVYLGRFYVRTDCQRSGFGSKFLAEIERKLKGHGYEYLILETQKKFYWAVKFYLKNGYSVLTNEDLPSSYFSKFYKRLVDPSTMFYKKL